MSDNEKLMKETLVALAQWPLDPYRKVPLLWPLGEPQWIGKRSAGVSLAAVRRLARATLEKVKP